MAEIMKMMVLMKCLPYPCLANAFGERLRDVPDEEVMDWHVPHAPEFSKIFAVPPVTVELSVSKPEKLSGYVEQMVEQVDESEKPCETHW